MAGRGGRRQGGKRGSLEGGGQYASTRYLGGGNVGIKTPDLIRVSVSDLEWLIRMI